MLFVQVQMKIHRLKSALGDPAYGVSPFAGPGVRAEESDWNAQMATAKRYYRAGVLFTNATNWYKAENVYVEASNQLSC
jgi:hypothetical protein